MGVRGFSNPGVPKPGVPRPRGTQARGYPGPGIPRPGPDLGYPDRGYPDQRYPDQGYPDQGYPNQDTQTRVGYPDRGIKARGTQTRVFRLVVLRPRPGLPRQGQGVPRLGVHRPWVIRPFYSHDSKRCKDFLIKTPKARAHGLKPSL